MPAPAPTRSRLASRPARAQRVAATRLALASFGITLLVAGCGGQAPATPTTAPAPRTTTAPSPTPSPTPEPEPEPTSTLPTSRAESSWEVVEQFFDAYTYGLQTGDSTRLKTLSTDDCATCANFIGSIEVLKNRQVVGTGGELSFPYSSGRKSPHPERKVWYIQFRQEPIDRTLKDPTDAFHQDETAGEMYVELTEAVDGWLVSKISATANDDGR